MALIGELPYFWSIESNWEIYRERLDQYLEVNEIPDDKKRALLITSLGDEVYKTLRDVCHPSVPKDKTYDELIELLNKQFVVRTSVFRERVKFYTAKQTAGENIVSWFARIQQLSTNCKFGGKYDAIVLDRFISGLRSGVILDRLCEEDETLTIQKAVEIATSKESSSANNNGASEDENNGKRRR